MYVMQLFLCSKCAENIIKTYMLGPFGFTIEPQYFVVSTNKTFCQPMHAKGLPRTYVLRLVMTQNWQILGLQLILYLNTFLKHYWQEKVCSRFYQPTLEVVCSCNKGSAMWIISLVIGYYIIFHKMGINTVQWHSSRLLRVYCINVWNPARLNF